MEKEKIIIGISGATGLQYGVKALELLKEAGVETHLVISKASEIVRNYETNYTRDFILDLADVVYPTQDIGAAIASGSFKTKGMLIAPCSVKTMSEIATGITSSLLSRSADVILKERRRLVLMFRETPLHLGHIQTMERVIQMRAIIMPPVPAFYANPITIDDIVTHSVAKALDLFDINIEIPRWNKEYIESLKK